MLRRRVVLLPLAAVGVALVASVFRFPVAAGNEASGGKDGVAPRKWLGLVCQTLSRDQKRELKSRHGLAVEEVFANSPAAKAGVMMGDVLLRFEMRELTSIEQLAELVRDHREAHARLELLRDGRERQITIALAERPAPAVEDKEKPKKKVPPKDNDAAAKRSLMQATKEAMEKLRQAKASDDAKEEARVPAVLTPLPTEFGVAVVQVEGQPAVAVVNWHDTRWRVTEQTAEQLPAEVRDHVRLAFQQTGDANHEHRAVPDTQTKLEKATRHVKELEARVEMLEKELAEARKKLDQKKRKK